MITFTSRRYVALFLCAIFITSLSLTQSSAATVKAGSPCPYWHIEKKVGGKLFLCSKLGSKLTWQPSVAEIQKSIWRDLQKKKMAQKIVSTSLDIHYSPTVNHSYTDVIVDGLNSAAQLWQAQYLPAKPLPTLFFTEKDRDWFIAEMNALGVTSPMQLANFDDEIKRNGDRASWAGVTGEGGQLWLVFMIGTGRNEVDRNMVEVSAHEFTHLAQFSIADQNQDELTCWQVEGGAYFYGAYLGSKSIKEIIASNQERDNDRGYSGYEGLLKVPSGGFEKLLDSYGPNYDHSKCGSDGAYPIGSIVHEYLYTLKGHEGIIALLKSVSTEGNYEAAIVKTYGKTWPAMRKEMANYLRLVASQI